MLSEIYKLIRKRGFHETILVLGKEERGLDQQKFFHELEQSQCSYYNAYLRVKNELIAKKIIAFRLNQQNEKVIYLTVKGMQIYFLLIKMEKVLNNQEA